MFHVQVQGFLWRLKLTPWKKRDRQEKHTQQPEFLCAVGNQTRTYTVYSRPTFLYIAFLGLVFLNPCHGSGQSFHCGTGTLSSLYVWLRPLVSVRSVATYLSCSPLLCFAVASPLLLSLLLCIHSFFLGFPVFNHRCLRYDRNVTAVTSRCISIAFIHVSALW